MNRKRRLSFELDRYVRATITALAFIAVLFGCIALMSWAKALQPFWLKLLISGAAAVLVGASIALFFLKAPKVF